MSRTNFSAGIGRLCLWWGGTALALGTFIWITRELCEGEVAPIDSYALKVFAKIRTPWLTSVAVDLTAVGSSTLIILFLAVTLLLLIMLRDRLGVFQLLATSTGAGILTLVTKNAIERNRPLEAQQLVVVYGFSYPSGHSLSTSALYLTVAIIGCRYVRHAGSRATIVLTALTICVTVAASRVYLGVHYPTDVASGFLLGAAWALLLNGFFALHALRRVP